MGLCLGCRASGYSSDCGGGGGYYHHHHHGGHHHWGAAPGCTEDHKYQYSTNVEGEKEGEGEFKCQICSSTVPAKVGRYHCIQCNIDVCKPCFEAPAEDERKPEEKKVQEKAAEAKKEEAPPAKPVPVPA